MFTMHISLLLGYSVLLASAVLLIWSLRNTGKGSSFGKIIGSIIFVLTLLSVLCINYYGIKYWAQGNFESFRGMPLRAREPMTQKMRLEMMQKMKERMEQRQ